MKGIPVNGVISVRLPDTTTGVTREVKSARISITTNVDTTIVAAVTIPENRRIRVLSFWCLPDAPATLTLKSGTIVGLGPMLMIAGVMFIIPDPHEAGFIRETAPGQALVAKLSVVANVEGVLNYVEV